MIAQKAYEGSADMLDILLFTLLFWTLFTVSATRRLKRITAANSATAEQQHAATQPHWIPQQVHVGTALERVSVNGTNVLVVLDRPKAPVGFVLERVAVWGDIAGDGGTLTSLVSFSGNGARCAISRNGTLHTCAGESIRWATDTELETGDT